MNTVDTWAPSGASGLDLDTAIDLFERGNPSHGPVPLWWWSGARLDPARLRWQMEQLLAGGVHQAVIMNLAPSGPLYGSLADDPLYMSEQWWEIFLGVCADARERGFRLWFYDQLGFSGANFQGGLVVERPERAGHALRRISAEGAAGTEVVCPPGGEPLAAYAVPADASAPQPIALDDRTARWDCAGPARVVLVYEIRRGFDYFSTEACSALLDSVHGEFERRAGEWFGTVIVGSFQDELPDMPTWGSGFTQAFRTRWGYDLLENIGHLWEPTSDPAATRTRRDYHALRAELAERAFFLPLAAWHERHGLGSGFDQQTPARSGEPVGSVQLYADYVRTHRHFSAPGSDHWGDAKLHSSISHARGHGRTWLEGFHSTGWGGSLEETYDWIAAWMRRGATLYDPHAVYYDTVGGWWEWAPPSTCWRQPYWPDYPQLARTVSRLATVFEAGTHVCDTAVLFPTSTVQAFLTLDAPLPEAVEARTAYEALNGHSTWMHESPGVLDTARHDYDVLDASLLGEARVIDGVLHVGDERYRNVVLPACAIVEEEVADLAAELADTGGRVVCVGAPTGTTAGPDSPAWQRFSKALSKGRILVTDAPGDVPDLLLEGTVRVDADVPVLVRRLGDAHVIGLFAHDDATGTANPILDDWAVFHDIDSFDHVRYFRELVGNGYGFRPVGARRAGVTVHGLPADDVQVWNPRDGSRSRLDVAPEGSGTWTADVAFTGGSVMLLTVGAGRAGGLVPVATEPAGDVIRLPSRWSITAESTIDNSWGDFTDRRVTGTVPLQVWRVEHGESDEGVPRTWSPALAGTGPFVEIAGPQRAREDRPGWREHHYSLSRGIPQDPLHSDSLGPNGRVPEEFLVWPEVGRGEWVGVRTTLRVPADGLSLVIGADADRQVVVDSEVLDTHGTGYWSHAPLRRADRDVHVEIWLCAENAGALRASFALVRDVEAYRRPEWLVPGDGSAVDTAVEFRRVVDLDDAPERALLQIGSEGTMTLLVNGVDVARHGGFDPYANRRNPRIEPHDIAAQLVAGRNEIVARFHDPGTPVALFADSDLVVDGTRLVSSADWTCTREGTPVPTRLRREQWMDPRWACLTARPHPLPGSSWLVETDPDAVVVPVVPDPGRRGRRTEWLRFRAPAGAVELTVPTALDLTVVVDDQHLRPDDGTVRLPRPLRHDEYVHLRFDVDDGHRAGALLDGPVEVVTSTTEAELADWAELGLGTLAGAVRYECTVDVAATGPAWLDLGEVRGTAEVEVNGQPAGTLAWGPYGVDVTGLLVDGTNTVAVTVRSTLAGYLTDASPTPAVLAGQQRCGLRGPVTLRTSTTATATHH